MRSSTRLEKEGTVSPNGAAPAAAALERAGRQRAGMRFESAAGERSRVVGSLVFATVGALLPAGQRGDRERAGGGHRSGRRYRQRQLGPRLLIEWLSVAKDARRTLRYENMPSQLHQLARLSEVEELLTAE